MHEPALTAGTKGSVKTVTSIDSYPQPDAPDPILDSDVVLDLIHRHVASSSPVREVDETGGEARAYLCDELVLKTQRPHRLRSRTSLQKEALVLEQLALHTSVSVPRLLGYGRDGDIEYEVLSRISGIALRDATISQTSRVAALHALGVTLRKIHRIDQSTMINSGLVPGDDNSSDVEQRLRDAFENLSESLSLDHRHNNVLDFAQLESRFFRDLDCGLDRVTLHSNPGPEHCFVEPLEGRFSGLIDFGDAYRSHPALDVRSWSSLNDSCRILAGYSSIEPVSTGFLGVWRAGIVLTQLRLVARGHSEAGEVAAQLEVLQTV